MLGVVKIKRSRAMRKLDEAIDKATHAVFDALEDEGFKTSRLDIDSAMYEVNDLLTHWARANVKESS